MHVLPPRFVRVARLRVPAELEEVLAEHPHEDGGQEAGEEQDGDDAVDDGEPVDLQVGGKERVPRVLVHPSIERDARVLPLGAVAELHLRGQQSRIEEWSIAAGRRDQGAKPSSASRQPCCIGSSCVHLCDAHPGALAHHGFRGAVHTQTVDTPYPFLLTLTPLTSVMSTALSGSVETFISMTWSPFLVMSNCVDKPWGQRASTPNPSPATGPQRVMLPPLPAPYSV